MSAQPAMSCSSLVSTVRSLPPESELTIHNVSWADYEHLLDELGDDYHANISYTNGRLMIMSPMYRHEMYSRLLLRLADVLADELDLEFESAGSTTFKHEDFQAGAEPDDCFYVQNAARVIGKAKLDPAVDPAPDVVIEIDISHVSQYKLDFYAHIGVPEIWRYDEQRLEILHLESGKDVERPQSLSLPILTADALTRFLEQSKTEGQAATRKAFRKWLKTGNA